jgi:membrane protein
VTEEDVPGALARNPLQIPWPGWVQILRRVFHEVRRDQLPFLAAGVAFYSFLALFPAAVAAVMLYGLFANPTSVKSQAEQLTTVLPDSTRRVVGHQIQVIISDSPHSVSLGLVLALVLAVWTASSGTGHLMMALNLAYDEEEARGFVERKAIALLLTIGGVVLVVLVVALLTAAPRVLHALIPPGGAFWLLQAVRWALLLLLTCGGIALLYLIAPNRTAPRLRWVSVGAVLATVVWAAATFAFTFYVSNFGRYSKTYGGFASVAVLMLWLWITNFIILLGAEINAEAEHQTAQDTTHGAPRPMGRRGAAKADTRPRLVDDPH